MKDLARIESEIVAGAARVLGSGPSGNAGGGQRAANPEAYDLYLRGEFAFINMRDLGDVTKAIGFFQKAIEKDPGSPLGYAGLANLYSLAIQRQYVPMSKIPEARGVAFAALQRDPGSFEAHGALGLIHYCEWDWTGALQELQHSLDINTSYAIGRHRLALVYFALHRFQDAEAELKRAAILDPLSLYHQATLSELYYYWRRYDESVGEARNILAANAEFQYGHVLIGKCFMAQRRYLDALAEFRKGQDPDHLTTEWQALALGAMGDKTRAQALLDEFAQDRRLHGFLVPNPWDLAVEEASMGDYDLALRNLEQAFVEHNPDLLSGKWDPAFDPLHNNPRFIAIFQRMGLSQ